jgi:hypothetical protein
MTDDVKPSENWRPVVGFEGWYEVSDLGRVRRVAPSHSTGRRQSSGILTPSRTGRGYLTVGLYRGSKRVTESVHRIVAAAFLGACPSGHEVNHRDGNKLNNGPANLEYTTRGGNVRHSVAAGLYRNGRTRLTAEQISEMRRRMDAGEPKRAIAKDFGVSESYAHAIHTREKRPNG